MIVGKFLDKFRHIKGVKLVLEPFGGFSPIYGIITGLKAAKNGKVLFVPGDTPFLRADVLRAFSKEIPPVVISEGDKLHSLFFLISKFQTYIVEKFLKSKKHKISELHRLIGSRKIDIEEFSYLDYQGRSALNLNTEEEFHKAIGR